MQRLTQFITLPSCSHLRVWEGRRRRERSRTKKNMIDFKFIKRKKLKGYIIWVQVKIMVDRVI